MANVHGITAQMPTEGIIYPAQPSALTVNGNGNTTAQPQHAGIPQSQSFTGVQTITSPQETPIGDSSDGENGQKFSPESSQAGRCTEPRNYAPRTSGQLVTQEPPPKFNLCMMPYGGQESSSDVFGPMNGKNGVVAPPSVSNLPPGSLIVAPAAQRSEKLKVLLETASGVPSFGTAMHPDNFPFAESSRKTKAINYGVVKIRNVSVRTAQHPPHRVHFLTCVASRFLLLPSVPR